LEQPLGPPPCGDCGWRRESKCLATAERTRPSNQDIGRQSAIRFPTATEETERLGLSCSDNLVDMTHAAPVLRMHQITNGLGRRMQLLAPILRLAPFYYPTSSSSSLAVQMARLACSQRLHYDAAAQAQGQRTADRVRRRPQAATHHLNVIANHT
jgi:hypothetical protein